jgi:hypothetical protein
MNYQPRINYWFKTTIKQNYFVQQLLELGRPGLHEFLDVGHGGCVLHRLGSFGTMQLSDAIDPSINRLSTRMHKLESKSTGGVNGQTLGTSAAFSTSLTFVLDFVEPAAFDVSRS